MIDPKSHVPETLNEFRNKYSHCCTSFHDLDVKPLSPLLYPSRFCIIIAFFLAIILCKVYSVALLSISDGPVRIIHLIYSNGFGEKPRSTECTL